WSAHYKELSDYCKEHGNTDVPSKYKHNPALGIWVKTQREHHKFGRLPDDRMKMLNQLGFNFFYGRQSDKTADPWLTRMLELKAYKDAYGNCNVPRSYPTNFALGDWVQNQRLAYKEDKIPQKRIEELKEMGFDFEIKTEPWNAQYDALVEFKAEHGHLRVPVHYEPNPTLYYWCGTQRQTHKKGKLAEDRVERLEGIGFQWNLAEFLWEKRKNDLVAYKERTGTFDVPHSEDPALHQWANNQKKMFNEKRLQQDKIDRLAEIGFDGAAGGESWEKRFMELVEYNNEFGHCIVPAVYKPKPALANWVSQQRIKYKNGTLPERYVDRLNDLGF
ncbi:hypothetical protein THAPSDRAFT_263911, partial [Thalassiosira pseudonana CCMP1335]